MTDQTSGVSLPPRECQPHWTGAHIGIEGLACNLSLPSGKAELVFTEDELEQIDEEGRTLYISRLGASEVLALRKSLNDYLPSDPIGEDALALRNRIAAIFHMQRCEIDGRLAVWRDVQPGSGAHLYAMQFADKVLAEIGIR